MTHNAMAWIMALGHTNDIDLRMDRAATPKKQFDYLFPNIPYSKTPNFNLAQLESWPNWKEPHPEVRAGKLGIQKYSHKDVEQMQSYIVSHFNLLAFTQPEMMEGLPMHPPNGFFGTWIGVKTIMCRATRAEGSKPIYEEKALIMEILNVKRVPWPEPGPKLLGQLLEAQTVKFSARPGAPLVPMMQTPKISLVAVRYSYMESHPKGGAQFLLHLESRLRKLLPSHSSDDDVRADLEKHLGADEEMPGEHIRPPAVAQRRLYGQRVGE
ncbi:hypothetical protein DFH08DRAFT_1071594 [Mycena albidolilacea]|uniref:Uncharacterized protein n=1 Tax=Mycena albidolilacea TaxID=1033008 RepID=A0AAD7AVY1_9AGAR|nr:hypothetical protein DFH08DRAFT_1071594 [Mycena albidolilacea]